MDLHHNQSVEAMLKQWIENQSKRHQVMFDIQ